MSQSSIAFDHASVRDTIRRLKACIDRRHVRQQEIATAIGIEKSRLSRWLNEHSGWSSIGRDNYARLLDFIAERKLFAGASYDRPEAAGIADIPFHGMVTFLGCDASAIDLARESLVGHYAGWRYSYFAPPDILKGALEILYDADSHALKTIEHFRVPADAMGEGSAEINFKRQGYIWPTQHNMYLMMSEKIGHRDIQVAYLNKSLHSALTLGSNAMHTIEGVVVDWQGPDFYMTKIVLHKLERALPLSEIGLRTEREVPNPVLAKLKERFMGPHHFLRVYR